MTTTAIANRIPLPRKLTAPVQHRCILITSYDHVPHRLIDIEQMDDELSINMIMEQIELHYISLKYLYQSKMRVFIGMIEPDQTVFIYNEINI